MPKGYPNPKANPMPNVDPAAQTAMQNLAQQQAAPPPRIREETRTPIRERKRKGGSMADDFAIDAELIPDGMSWEWKRHTVHGQTDYGYEVGLREQGWEPVDSGRLSQFMPEGHKGAIIRKGMMLMERPKELTEEARREDLYNARAQVQVQKQKALETPAGTMPRDHEIVQKVTKMRSTYEPVKISDDE